MFLDPTFLLLIPALALAFFAQIRVRSAFKKYSQIPNRRGMTGYQAARRILEMNNLHDVNVEEVPGTLSDHYDPRDRTVRLSTDNYRGASLAALSVAAHEVGHAIQHATGYSPLKIRHSILPVTNLGSWAAFPLFMIGFLFRSPLMMDLGILFFAGVVLFHLVTLPVEFNASSRAIKQLAGGGYITTEEAGGAKSVLNAAALTYVAAAAVSAMHLVRLLMLRGMSRE
ncbi:MAG: zinc metallopeptidase [Calditrichaceae bacterium]|nr:zinc metallopeptidase [Calditrichia bacterium]NUQ43998.1 zinc metallopeptidase [Calditrichaceae bacterium]